MKSKIFAVKVRNRVEQFTNERAARAYARKWGGVVESVNESWKGGTSGLPVKSPGTVHALGLPISATQQEFETAWKANGGHSAKLNAEAVRTALITLAMREQKIGRAAAEDFVRARCPRLFDDRLRSASGMT